MITETNLIEACAQIAHEANRVFCEATGDNSQKTWAEAEAWQRQSAIEGVQTALAGATPEQQHEAWCASKIRDGWRHGETKDSAAKTHPCLVPYASLPAQQRAKDALYQAVVRGMHAALTSAAEPAPAPPDVAGWCCAPGCSAAPGFSVHVSDDTTSDQSRSTEACAVHLADLLPDADPGVHWLVYPIECARSPSAEKPAAPESQPRTTPVTRSHVDQMTPAEFAIREAMHAVEAAGADERLTQAVCLLDEASAKVYAYALDRESKSRTVACNVLGEPWAAVVAPDETFGVLRARALTVFGVTAPDEIEMFDQRGRRCEPEQPLGDVERVYFSRPVGVGA